MKKFSSDDKIFVTSMVYGTVGVSSPTLRRRYEWQRKGAKVKVPYGDLEDLVYDPGFEYMIRNGILYIEDMDVKVALGLEDEDSEELNIKILTDTEIEALLKPEKRLVLEKTMKENSLEQNKIIAQYAIEHGLTDTSINDIIKKYSEIDVIKTISFGKEE